MLYGFTSFMAVPSESCVGVSGDSVKRERRMIVLYETMNVVVSLLQELELRRFVVKTRILVAWNGVPLLVSFCFPITDTKDFSSA